MRSFTSIKRSIPIILVLGLAATVFAESGKVEGDVSQENWNMWVGKKVKVDYLACDQRGCVLVRSAELKEVTDKAIVVIVRGAPFYIPRYMIKRVTPSTEPDQVSESQ